MSRDQTGLALDRLHISNLYIYKLGSQCFPVIKHSTSQPSVNLMIYLKFVDMLYRDAQACLCVSVSVGIRWSWYLPLPLYIYIYIYMVLTVLCGQLRTTLCCFQVQISEARCPLGKRTPPGLGRNTPGCFQPTDPPTSTSKSLPFLQTRK